MSSKKLNEKQLDILNTVLRFRYVTTDNLSKQRNITHNSAYSALEILYTDGYLGKLHDKTYRLQNKAARYFLTLQAIDYLRNTDQQITEKSRNNRRREQNRSTDFIDQQVAIHAAYIDLRQRFGAKVKILVADDMQSVDGIIKPLPGLLVEKSSSKSMLIDLTDGQHLFLVKKRIRKYIDHYESDDWEWDEYPDVYIIRSSPQDRSQLRRYIEEQMNDNYLDEDDFSFRLVASVSDIIVA